MYSCAGGGDSADRVVNIVSNFIHPYKVSLKEVFRKEVYNLTFYFLKIFVSKFKIFVAKKIGFGSEKSIIIFLNGKKSVF